MEIEARRVLAAFRDRGVHAGGFIHFTDFGDAIIWEGGYIRDESVRDALRFLIDNEYVVELNAGLELTAEGEAEAFGGAPPHRYSARVYLVDGMIVVKQASLRGSPAEYSIDEGSVRRVTIDDESGLADAVRDAISGRL